MTKSYDDWLKYINQQLNFYKKRGWKSRKDDEFDWDWLYPKISKFLPGAKLLISSFRQHTTAYTGHWLNENSKLLWNVRHILADELSKHLFDCHLLLKVLSYEKQKFYKCLIIHY